MYMRVHEDSEHRTRPDFTGYSPSNACTSVDLPPPDAPTSATFSPGATIRLTSSSTVSPSP